MSFLRSKNGKNSTAARIVCIGIYMHDRAVWFRKLSPCPLQESTWQARDLENMNWCPTDPVQFLQPATTDEEEFWQHQNAGLALFISGRIFLSRAARNDYWTGGRRSPSQAVNSAVKRRWPLAILTLGQRDVSEGSNRYGITCEVGRLPKSMDEALAWRNGEGRTAADGRCRSCSPAAACLYHGQAIWSRNVKEDLRNISSVDKALHDFFFVNAVRHLC